MTTKAYPRLGETLYTTTLPNGLTLHVVPKPGFRSYYAVLAANYGGDHRRFSLGGDDRYARRRGPLSGAQDVRSARWGQRAEPALRQRG